MKNLPEEGGLPSPTKATKGTPPARTDRPYLAQIRALGTIFHHPRESIHRARKTVSQAKCVKSKTAPRTPQKLQLRHKQKSVYPRAHVAHFTAAVYTAQQKSLRAPVTTTIIRFLREATMFQRINTDELNGRQKEIYNFQKSAALLADYGFNCIKLADDWNGADFLAHHFDGTTTLKVQLKARLTIDRKYVGQDLWMNFPCRGTWYLVPHDKLVELAGHTTNWLNTSSWQDTGLYSSTNPAPTLLEQLRPYAIEGQQKSAVTPTRRSDEVPVPSAQARTPTGRRDEPPRSGSSHWRHPNLTSAARALTGVPFTCA